MELPNLYCASPRGQVAVMLLAALRQLYIDDGYRNVTKRQTIEYISREHWFALTLEDHQPYPSQDGITGEPRWHTLVAWARKDSVLRDLVSYESRDAWGLTRFGRDAFEKLLRLTQSGRQSVAPCFLWSVTFKSLMWPEYAPNGQDAKRPRSFYRDIWPVPDRYLEIAEAILRNGTWSHFIPKYRAATGKDPGNWNPTSSHQHNVDSLARLVAEYMDAAILKML